MYKRQVELGLHLVVDAEGVDLFTPADVEMCIRDRGEVVAVGPGKKTEDGKILPVDLKAGDKVLFGKYAGQSVKVDGEELLVIREDEILAVVQ